MKRLDIVAALVMLALSAIVVVGTCGLPYWTDYAPGPAFAAFWVAGAGVLLVVRASRPGRWRSHGR